MHKFEETHNTHQNNAESSSWLILTFSVFTESSFTFVNCMIPLNSTWVPSLGDKTHAADLLDFYSERSSTHPVPFPGPAQHQSSTLSLQAAGTWPSAPSSLPGPPQPQPLPHLGIMDLQPLFKMAKGREMYSVCSESLYRCVHVRQRPLFPSPLL